MPDWLVVQAGSVSAAVNNKIALVRRGTCNFTDKLANVQNAGDAPIERLDIVTAL